MMWFFLCLEFVIAFVFMLFLMETVRTSVTLGDVLLGFVSIKQGHVVFVMFWGSVIITVALGC